LSPYEYRRKKLLSLARGRHVVARTRESLYYLTDFYGEGAGIVLPDKTILVTGSLEEERAKESGKEVEVVAVKKWKDIPKIVLKLVEKGDILVDEDEWLRSKRFMKNKELFLKARKVKDEAEIERIRKASEKVDKIFEVLPSLMKVGMTEWQIAAEVMRLATELRLAPPKRDAGFDPFILASGEHGAMGHAQLSERNLKKGDFVVADIFFRFEGYHTDATRTFAVGTPSKEMKDDYEAVKEAQETALELAKTGSVCESVHKKAISILRKHRVARFMNHSLGHGVGIGLHESPFLGVGNKTKLERNDIVTIEPGVYRVGKYGIRIEDTLRVDGNPEVLTKFTKELIKCG
jgi:Xaa-Pro aminopeptidase